MTLQPEAEVEIEHLQAGDKAAWNAFYKKTQQELNALLSRSIPDKFVVQECIAHAMQQFWVKREQLPGRMKVVGYLYRAAVNKYHDLRRFDQIRVDHQERVLHYYTSMDAGFVYPDEAPGYKQDEEIEHLLSLLPPRQVQVIRLIIKGKSCKAISQLLNIAPQTVRNIKANAINTLMRLAKPAYTLPRHLAN